MRTSAHVALAVEARSGVGPVIAAILLVAPHGRVFGKRSERIGRWRGVSDGVFFGVLLAVAVGFDLVFDGGSSLRGGEFDERLTTKRTG